MTHDPTQREHPDTDIGSLPDALRWQLRALRREHAPARDLWPDIATRLPARDAATARPTRMPRWLAPTAMAASLLLVVGVLGWNSPLRPAGTPSPPSAHPAVADTARPGAQDPGAASASMPVLVLEAAGLTRQYQAAFDEIGVLPVDGSLHPAIAELDRSAELILDALTEQPDSRRLLDQLHRTYARRLTLSQRLLHS